MKTIWKYKLKTVDFQQVEMPFEAKILTVQNQHETPCIWCLVDPNNEKELRTIQIIGTGHENEDIEGVYIGSYQLSGGVLVFHVFEIYD